MAEELSKAEVQAAADRATDLSLPDDDLVLVTAKQMPERLRIKGGRQETAGTEVHGELFTYTRRDVDRALADWGTERAGRRRGRPPGSTERAGRGRGAQRASDRRRRGGAQTEGANLGTAATDTSGTEASGG